MKKANKINKSVVPKPDEEVPSIEFSPPPNKLVLPASFSWPIFQRILEGVSQGIPIIHALRLVGKEGQYKSWRKKKALREYMDSELARAEAVFIKTFLKPIADAAKNTKSWQAAAWLLERRYPSEFAAGRGIKVKGAGDRPLLIQIISNIPRPDEITKARVRMPGDGHKELIDIETTSRKQLEEVREEEDE